MRPTDSTAGHLRPRVMRPTAVAGAAFVLSCSTGGRARTRSLELTRVPARVVHLREPRPSAGTVGAPVHHHRPGWRIPRFAHLDQALAQVARHPNMAAASQRSPGTAGGTGPPARPGQGPGLADESRRYAQCGAVFAPQREHARFRSAGCRTTWNREHLGDPAVEASALSWSVTAISEATGPRQGPTPNRPRHGRSHPAATGPGSRRHAS